MGQRKNQKENQKICWDWWGQRLPKEYLRGKRIATKAFIKKERSQISKLRFQLKTVGKEEQSEHKGRK